jgi:hypothetical protein
MNIGLRVTPTHDDITIQQVFADRLDLKFFAGAARFEVSTDSV